MKLFDGSDSFVVVDVETTGMSFEDSRVIEIGAVKMVNGKIADEFNSLLATVDHISSGTSMLTGITNKEYEKHAQSPVKVMREFREFMGDLVFIAHNVYFDFDFINAELVRYDQPIVSASRLCSIKVAKAGFPYLPTYRLSFLKDYMGISCRSHRGLDDAKVALEIVNRYGNLVPLDNRVVDEKRYGNISVIPLFK